MRNVGMSINGSRILTAPRSHCFASLLVAIGGIIIGLMLVAFGIWWFKRPEPALAVAEASDESTYKELLTQIALLDDAHERGEMDEAKKNRIGYLPEERGLYKDLKLEPTLIFLARLKGLSEAEARRRLPEWLKRLDLWDARQKKIQDLEQKLASCEIVVGRKFVLKQAEFGTIIVIQNIETGETQRYQLVGPYESNVLDGKLSIDSPVGRHLVGRREGEEVIVYTPAGVRMYRVVSITL